MNSLTIKSLINSLHLLSKFFTKANLTESVPVIIEVGGKLFAIENVHPAYDGIMGYHLVVQTKDLEI